MIAGVAAGHPATAETLYLIGEGDRIVGAILVASSAGTHGPALVAVAVVLGCVGFALLVLWFFVFMLLWVPAAVFFQSYALYYFGSRYPALAALLWLDSPSAPPLTQSGPDLPPIPTPA